jgi:hypothetical protein
METREKKSVINLLKGHLKKAHGNATAMQEIQTRLTLMENLVKEQKNLEHTVKEKYMDAQSQLLSSSEN